MPVLSNHLMFTTILAVVHCGHFRPSDDSVTLFMRIRWATCKRTMTTTEHIIPELLTKLGQPGYSDKIMRTISLIKEYDRQTSNS